MRLPRRQFGSLVSALLACALGLSACSGDGPVRQPPREAKPDPEAAPEPVTISVAAVGDIMLGTDYPDDRLPTDGAALLEPVADVLRAADVTFGNLEGVLIEGGEARKRCRDPNACYLFRSPPHYARHLKDAGFDVVSLANNHAGDFGEEGRSATMRALDEAGILHSGRFGTMASWEVRGTRVGMLAFAPFVGANPMLDPETASAMIRDAARDHAVLIVSMHAGAEGAEHQHVPFTTEYFHGEDRGDVVAFARAAVEAGADLVLGHGPHVPRAMELYRDRLIAYSLGNFCTYWGIKVSGANGLAPVLVASLGPEGEFQGGRIVSARQQRPLGPLADANHEAARLIGRLIKSDFPQSRLRIGRLGELQVVEPADPAVSAALGP